MDLAKESESVLNSKFSSLGGCCVRGWKRPSLVAHTLVGRTWIVSVSLAGLLTPLARSLAQPSGLGQAKMRLEPVLGFARGSRRVLAVFAGALRRRRLVSLRKLPHPPGCHARVGFILRN
jgi:hypothetical protein